MAQALDNLIANSLEYGAGPVELTSAPSGEVVELHVLDRGAGFSDEFIDRAFERFSRDPGGEGAQGTASAWRSSRPSPAPTAAASPRATGRVAAPTWLTLPQA